MCCPPPNLTSRQQGKTQTVPNAEDELQCGKATQHMAEPQTVSAALPDLHVWYLRPQLLVCISNQSIDPSTVHVSVNQAANQWPAGQPSDQEKRRDQSSQEKISHHKNPAVTESPGRQHLPNQSFYTKPYSPTAMSSHNFMVT